MRRQQKVYLVLGRTQQGKSTLIRFACNLEDDEIEVGSGGGSSCTSRMKLYLSKQPFLENYSFIDTRGFGENRSLMDDKEIRNKIEENLLEFTDINEISGIILLESLSDSSDNIDTHLESIRNIFGTIPTHSILLLVTKANLVDDDETKAKRLDNYHEHLQKHQIPTENILFMLCPCRQIEKKGLVIDFNTELQKFKTAIDNLTPFPLDTIKVKRDLIKRRALEIQQTDKIHRKMDLNLEKVHLHTKTKEHILEKEHYEEKKVQEIVMETIQRKVQAPKIVDYQEPVTYQVPEITTKKSGNLIKKVIGKNVSQEIEYVTKTKMENRQRIEYEEKLEEVEVPKVKERIEQVLVPEKKIELDYQEAEIYNVMEKKEFDEERSWQECIKMATKEFRDGKLKMQA